MLVAVSFFILHCRLLHQRSNPGDELSFEQMEPFVERVLKSHSCWSVYSMGLLLRSRIEKQKIRKVDRATFQMQALVDQVKEISPSFAERMDNFFSVSCPSIWNLERELAYFLKSVGALKSSCEIFERLQMWDDLIETLLMSCSRDRVGFIWHFNSLGFRNYK